MERQIKFNEAIREATDLCMAEDENVYVIGLGVPDPKGIFGTTLGLQEKYGEKRVLDMPTSENAMTGILIGSALKGKRPIMTHQRVDFTLLSLDQIINNAAKWHYMFGSKQSVPLVIRIVIGRGWGQGPQHSQTLCSLFSHIPGLKVVAPSTPQSAKGLLVAAVRDNNPVIYFEHRWLHTTFGHVPQGDFEIPIGTAARLHRGDAATIVSYSYMTIEALRAATYLEKQGIGVDIIDLQSLRPFDMPAIRESVARTGRLIVADLDWRTHGYGAEIVARCSEELFPQLKAAPVRITAPDYPSPSSAGLSRNYYPHAIDIVNAVRKFEKLPPIDERTMGIDDTLPRDVPDSSFTGPF